MTVSLDDQIREIRREIGLRRFVYPNLILKLKLTRSRADSQLAAMEAVLETLEKAKAVASNPQPNLI